MIERRDIAVALAEAVADDRRFQFLGLLSSGQQVHDGSDGADEHDDERPDQLVVPDDAPLGLEKVHQRKHD